MFWDDALALASGATLVNVPGAATVIVTVADALRRGAVRHREREVRVAEPVGAVKVGATAVVLDSVTAGPAVWVHA